VLCLSASLGAQTTSWQSSGGNTTTTDKVGIGANTAPSSILELNAPAVVQTIRYTDANYGSLYFYENTTFVGFLQMVGSTYTPYPSARNALMLGNLAAGPEIFYTSGAERLRIDASGNVGIGTSAPAAKLQVEDLNNNAEMLVSAGDNPGVPNSPTLSLMRKDGNDVQLAKYGLKLDAADGNKFKLLYGGTGAFTATPLVVDTSGNVGIGTSAPTKKLQVLGSISLNNDSSTTGLNNAYFIFDGGSSGWSGYNYGMSLGFKSGRYRTMLFSHDGADVGIATHAAGTVPTSQANFTERLTVQGSTGNVGIGVTSPSYPLSVAGTIQTSVGVLFPDGIVQTAAYPFSTASNTSDLNRAVAGLLTSSVTNTSTSGSANLAAIAGSGVSYLRLASNENPATRDWRIGMMDSSGIFKIRDNAASTDRMTINGSAITFNGNVTGTTIQATYQDLAEWVPAAEPMIVGTVVVVAEDANNTVTASAHAYDTSVAGVVSANPGLLLGVASESKAKIATTGRVRVRVDATKSPIRKGDLLVTSDRPGMAMKSEPLDLGGVKLHRPGTLIGKALEPLAGGEGEILVLLSLQ
jgi:hypothetical protein